MVCIGMMVGLQRLRKVFRYITAYVGKSFKYCPKYNEINMRLSDVQKHVSCTGLHKRFLIYYGLCLETAGNVFFNCVSSFVSTILNFKILYDAY